MLIEFQLVGKFSSKNAKFEALICASHFWEFRSRIEI